MHRSSDAPCWVPSAERAWSVRAGRRGRRVAPAPLRTCSSAESPTVRLPETPPWPTRNVRRTRWFRTHEERDPSKTRARPEQDQSHTGVQSMTTTLVRTRYAGVHDLEQVLAMHRRCSPETLHRRFHVPVPVVRERLVRRLLTGPGWGLLAEQCDEVVGLACAGPLSPRELEVGLLVEDSHQGTGVGTRLMRDIAVEARTRGYTRL